MTFLLLNLITASRTVCCPIIWFWCWRRRPKRMVLWMVLCFAYFLVTDKYDGEWAVAYGLRSELGFWLDHVGDFLFYGVVVLSILRGTTEPPPARRGRKSGGAGAGPLPTTAAPAAHPHPEAGPASSTPAAPPPPADAAAPGTPPPS